MRKPFLWPSVSMALFIAACGGGGSSGSGVSAVRPFVAFDRMPSGQTVEASGISQSATMAVDDSGAITSSAAHPMDATSNRIQFSTGSDMALSRLIVSTPHSSQDWSGGAEIGCDAIACDMANDRAIGMVVNGPGLGWNYQTFGYWVAEAGPASAVTEVVSFGNPSPAGGVPIEGTANYVGVTAGLYVDADGWPSDYAASLAATVDFGAARSVGFSTTRSMILPLGAEDVIAAPELDLAGTLSISPGLNRFSGPISTGGASAPLTGTASGSFYGPNAEEIGGVFALTGEGVEGLIGGFGGIR